MSGHDSEATEVQELHVRLDAAEEGAIRVRYLSDEIMAEFAGAGHAYFAALQGGSSSHDLRGN